jgi:hypothetical protein
MLVPKLCVVVHTCNPRTGEDEAGGLQVQGQPVQAISKKYGFYILYLSTNF